MFDAIFAVVIFSGLKRESMWILLDRRRCWVPEIFRAGVSSFGGLELAGFWGSGEKGTPSGSSLKFNLPGVGKPATGRLFMASFFWARDCTFNCARKLPLAFDFRIFSKFSKFTMSLCVWFEYSKYCRLLVRDSPLV